MPVSNGGDQIGRHHDVERQQAEKWGSEYLEDYPKWALHLLCRTYKLSNELRWRGVCCSEHNP